MPLAVKRMFFLVRGISGRLFHVLCSVKDRLCEYISEQRRTGASYPWGDAVMKSFWLFSRIRALVLRSSRTVNHNLEFCSFTSDMDPSSRCSFAKPLLSGKLRSVRHLGVGELHLVRTMSLGTPADLWDHLLYVKGTGITFFRFSKEMKRDNIWTYCILFSVYYIQVLVI